MNKELKKGSLTIEASLVLPIFLFAMFLVMSLMNLMRFHLNLQEAVHQETRMLAMTAYSEWNASSASIGGRVIARLDPLLLKKAPIKGGASGIDLSSSRLDNREVIEVNASYESKLPYDFFNLFEKTFCARCMMHTFIGYEKGLSETEAAHKDEEEYVYITETGTVYHTDRECTYLRLSIKEVDRSALSGLRNNSGHKYYACECCGKKAGSRVYITGDGTCYHSSLECSGLKRTVTCVPKSQVEGRKVCSRCGH
ncbi:MAG: pilus assembly protein [Lachnospiraceae bacterium]|nr:pilus assembly protein [Lachnospiraceae bacterium]